MEKDEFLRPRLGRMRKHPGSRRFVSDVLAAAQRAGAPHRRPPGTGAGTPQGRGGVAAWRAGQRLLTERGRRVVIKARVVRQGRRSAPLRVHAAYLKRDGVTRDGQEARMFDAASDDADDHAFTTRCEGDRHHFRFIVSPEDAGDLGSLKTFTRELMAQAETDLGTRLDWVAVEHWNTDNPHVHLLVRGVAEDGRDLVIHRTYIGSGLRARAEHLVTLELGPRSEQEIRARLVAELGAERWTRLDATLKRAAGRVEDGIIDLRPGGEGAARADPIRGLMIGRLQRLARMGLAQPVGPAQWMLAEEAEPSLRDLGIRGDVIKTMHKALSGERGTAEFVVAPDRPSIIIGRVAGKGLDDELAGHPYLIVEGVDGRAHYIRLGRTEQITDLPEGGVVRIEPRRDGRGTYVRVLSDLPIERQIAATGATWLDRELLAREKAVLGMGGFGAEVGSALDARISHLTGEGLARFQAQRVVFARDLLDTLTRREISEAAERVATERGLAFRPLHDGERVAGVYRQRLDLASGRFALIEQPSREFSLVPWRPEIERRLGQEVAATVRGRTVDWSLSRDRGPTIG